MPPKKRATKIVASKPAPQPPAERARTAQRKDGPRPNGEDGGPSSESRVIVQPAGRRQKAAPAARAPIESQGGLAARIVAERRARLNAAQWWTATILKPPSVNTMFRDAGYGRDTKRKGRIRTKAYSAWAKAASLAILSARPPRFPAEYEILIELGRRKGSDAFNYEKGISDLLKTMGIIRDDSLMEDGRVTWANDLGPKEARISLRAWKAPPAAKISRGPCLGGSAEGGFLAKLDGARHDDKSSPILPAFPKKQPCAAVKSESGLFIEATEAGDQLLIVPPVTAAQRRATMGNACAPRAARGNDLYQSPPAAVRALLANAPDLNRPRFIWEPACGPGVIANELRAAGHLVIASDLVDYGARMPDRAVVQDFFRWTKAPEGADTIITNPPYLAADKFIRHALKLAPRVYMLLRLGYMQGKNRSDLIDKHLSAVYPFVERITMHRDGWEGPKVKSGMVAHAWFLFERAPPTPGQWVTRRISINDRPGRGI